MVTDLTPLIFASILASLCVGSLFVLRAGLFCLIGDALFTLASCVFCVLVAEGLTGGSAAAMAIAACVLSAAAFALARELVGDDILASIVINWIVLGIVALFMPHGFKQIAIDASRLGTTPFLAMVAVTVGLVAVGWWVLDQTKLRIRLAAAKASDVLAATYPFPTTRYRFLAAACMGFYVGLAGILYASANRAFSVDQWWAEPLYLWAFGIAFAFVQRLRWALLISTLVGLARGWLSAVQAAMQDYGPYVGIVLYLMIISVIVLASAHARRTRRPTAGSQAA